MHTLAMICSLSALAALSSRIPSPAALMLAVSSASLIVAVAPPGDGHKQAEHRREEAARTSRDWQRGVAGSMHGSGEVGATDLGPNRCSTAPPTPRCGAARSGGVDASSSPAAFQTLIWLIGTNNRRHTLYGEIAPPEA